MAAFSAKIYSFPAGGREGLLHKPRDRSRGERAPDKSVRDIAIKGVPILSASGWYHDEAMSGPSGSLNT